MEISHVMRAEEWLPSAPRHQALYEAFGYAMPLLVHLPIILGPDRSKLSKRHGATSVLHFRDQGYLRDAMLNFLALLGWSLDEASELLTREELVEHFTLERILANPAVFDHEKLDWFNGVYVRQMNDDQLALAILPWLEADDSVIPASARPIDRPYLASIIPLERDRLKRLSDAPGMLSFFFEDQLAYDASSLVQKGMDPPGTLAALGEALLAAEITEDWTVDSLESVYRRLAERLALKTGQLFGAIRVAVTGRTAAPPLFDTLAVLGKERCLSRLRYSVDLLSPR
jgi:glutamyl-tRNA synthetase